MSATLSVVDNAGNATVTLLRRISRYTDAPAIYSLEVRVCLPGSADLVLSVQGPAPIPMTTLDTIDAGPFGPSLAGLLKASEAPVKVASLLAEPINTKCSKCGQAIPTTDDGIPCGTCGEPFCEACYCEAADQRAAALDASDAAERGVSS